MFVSDLNQAHPLDCLVVAHVRSDFADCTWFYDHGYIRYYDGTKVMLREHQRVAMAAYGIPNGFHVHHIDSNRLNNRADNLAVLSASEHMRVTASEPRAERITINCSTCGKPFQSTAYRVEKRNKTYCSEPCMYIGKRKFERPSSQYLAELITEVNNWSALGRMFKVTDNTVRDWARSYGLL